LLGRAPFAACFLDGGFLAAAIELRVAVAGAAAKRG